MVESYLSVSGETENETVIERSRFICRVKRVESEDDARAFIEEVRKKHSTATHNCYAYVASEDGNLMKFSDDGEPQGTAGMPMLEVLKNRKLYRVAVVVTRYFGGIKLGAGGLVRAYTNSANLSLNECKIVEFKECVKYSTEVSHDIANRLVNSIENGGGKILKIEYAEKAIIHFIYENVDSLKSIFWDITFNEIGKEIICL